MITRDAKTGRGREVGAVLDLSEPNQPEEKITTFCIFVVHLPNCPNGRRWAPVCPLSLPGQNGGEFSEAPVFVVHGTSIRSMWQVHRIGIEAPGIGGIRAIVQPVEEAGWLAGDEATPRQAVGAPLPAYAGREVVDDRSVGRSRRPTGCRPA